MKRLAELLSILAVLAILPAAVAQAHEGNPDFRSQINGVNPPQLGEGLELEVKNFDDNVNLDNGSGETVQILGYDEEPYVRIAPGGLVEVNRNSPSYYLNQDRFANVELPDRADSAAAPEWEEVDETGAYSWHDHRSHYMSEGTPPQVEDESARTEVFDYSIPIRVGTQPAQIEGTLIWVGRDTSFPIAPFIGLALLLVVGTAVIVVRRRRRDDGDRSEGGGDPEAAVTEEAW